jgi:LysM repeat protein
MRVRTRSACVVLAWGILLIMTAVGSLGSLRTAQANIRIASNIGSTSNSSTIHAILTSRVIGTAARTSAGPRSEAVPGPGGYVVQPGDTLSGIAAAIGVRGGWPALYAANRTAIGSDPGLIRPGTVLTLPDRVAGGRHAVWHRRRPWHPWRLARALRG